MLPIIPFDVLLPLAVGTAVLALLVSSFLIVRKALVRWWTEGGERQGRKAESLIRHAMEGRRPGRLDRWLSWGPAGRIRVFVHAVVRIGKQDPGVMDWLRNSTIPETMARVVQFPRGPLSRMGVPGGRWRKVAALQAIGNLGLPARDTLLRALDDPDSEVAYAAVEAVAGVDFPGGARAIFERIGPASPLLDSRLASAVETMRSEVTDLLHEALEGDDPVARYWALTIIGRKRVYELVDEVRPHLESEDSGVRVAACKCLGQVKVRLTDRWLRPLLRDESWVVQAQAVKALGGMRAGWAAEDIATLLTSPHWWVRQNAVQALIELGEDSIGPVEKVLGSEDRYARHSAVEVLARIGWVDSMIVRAAGGDARAMEILEQYGRSHGLAHLENALQQVRESAVPFLLSLLERMADSSTYGRIRAARYRLPPELQALCIETADRVRAR